MIEGLESAGALDPNQQSLIVDRRVAKLVCDHLQVAKSTGQIEIAGRPQQLFPERPYLLSQALVNAESAISIVRGCSGTGKSVLMGDMERHLGDTDDKCCAVSVPNSESRYPLLQLKQLRGHSCGSYIGFL